MVTAWSIKLRILAYHTPRFNQVEKLVSARVENRLQEAGRWDSRHVDDIVVREGPRVECDSHARPRYP